MKVRAIHIFFMFIIPAFIQFCGDSEIETHFDEDGRNSLHIAVLENDLEKAIGIISDTSLINMQDRYGFTPLHYACRAANLNLVEILLSKGAAINILNNYNEIPLHWAAIKGQDNIVELLLAGGADPFMRDKGGRTPAVAALDGGLIDTANLLFPLHQSIRNNDNSRFKELIRTHPDLVHSRDGFGFTPLHAAYKCDNVTAVEFLKKNGADPELKDDFGYLPEFYSKVSRNKSRGYISFNRKTEEKIDTYIYHELQKYDNINLGLVLNGEIALTKNYGKPGLNKAYAYGSVSKALTGMIVMQMLQEGLIKSLDDNIWEYSDRYINSLPDEYGDADLTFRHLIIHRSGIPHNNEQTWKKGKLNLRFKPGENDMYSTPAYGVIGQVLEDIADLSFDQLVKNYIGRPVGASSFWAQDHFRAPGARIFSNIKDMALFARGVVNNIYIPENVLREQVMTKQSRLTGISWQIDGSGEDDIKIFHGGSNGKPQAYLAIIPAKKLAVCILATRKDKYSFELGRLADDLLGFMERLKNNNS